MSDEQDLAELAAVSVSYETPIDHYREMARRFAESRDELKHHCRAFEAENKSLREALDQLLASAYGNEPAVPVSALRAILKEWDRDGDAIAALLQLRELCESYAQTKI